MVVNFYLIDGSSFSFLIGPNFLAMVTLDELKHQSFWKLLFPIIKNSI